MFEFTDANFEFEVIQSAIPVLVDFYTTTCNPCKALAPILKEVSNEIHSIKFGKLNVDENIKTAMSFGIRGVPTLILFKEGKIVDKVIGIQSKENLKKMILKHVWPRQESKFNMNETGYIYK